MPDNTQKITPEEYRATASERSIQEAVINWCQWKGYLVYAVPNGQYRRGERPEPGLQRGVPDLCVPVARIDPETRAVFGALYIELKRPGGRVRKEQEAWLKALRQAGNRAVVCYSVGVAMEEIEAYMRLEAVI